MQAILRLAGDGDLRWQLGLGGRRRVEQRFDIQENATQLLAIFEIAARDAALWAAVT